MSGRKRQNALIYSGALAARARIPLCLFLRAVRRYAEGFAVGLSLLRSVLGILVRFPRHHRLNVEVEGWRRRSGHPFEADCAPWIVACSLAILQRPYQVDARDDQAEREDGCP